MKSEVCICNNCKKSLDWPALIGVKIEKLRYNTGAPYGRVMGFQEMTIEGDFCDIICLKAFILDRMRQESGTDCMVRQDLFFRGDGKFYEKNSEIPYIGGDVY